MTGAQGSQASAFGFLVHSFQDEFTNHRNELRVSPYTRGPDHVQAQLIRKCTGLRVEVVHHFHMVRDKANRNDHNVLRLPLRGDLPQMLQDIRTEPRLRWLTAPALKNQRILSPSHLG